jgi:hypothetical protein
VDDNEVVKAASDKLLILHLSPDGQISQRNMPPGVANSLVDEIIRLLSEAPEVKPNQFLGERYQVHEVRSNAEGSTYLIDPFVR